MSQPDISQQDPLVDDLVPTNGDLGRPPIEADNVEQQAEAQLMDEPGAQAIVEPATEGSETAQETEHVPVRSSSRDQKQTEKGLQYEIDLYSRHFKASVSAWRKAVNKTSIIMSDVTEIDKIRSARDQVISNMNEIYDVYGHLTSLPLEEDKKSHYNNQFESIEEEHNRVLSKVSERNCEIQAEIASRGSVRSVRTNRTRHSRVSNTSRHSEAAAEAAALATKLRYIDSEAKWRAELDRVTTQRKLEMAQAKMRVLDEEAGLFGFETKFPDYDQTRDYTKEYVESHCKVFMGARPKEVVIPPAVKHEVIKQPDNIHVKPYSALTLAQGFQPHALGKSETHVNSLLDPDAKEFEPPITNPQPVGTKQTFPIDSKVSANINNAETTQNPSVASHSLNVNETGNLAMQEVLKLTKTLAEQVSLSCLPPPEPAVFDGDPLKYPGWSCAFHTLIELKQIPATEKIHFLRKYLSGFVREVVENYFLLSSEDAFEEAKKLLE